MVGISGQPFALSWACGVRRERQIPVLFVRFADGRGLVVECRPVGRADERFHRVPP